MESFLCELFDVPSLQSIENYAELFDVKNNTLKYTNIWTHPRIHFNLVFRFVYNAMFGITPSKITVYESSLHTQQANVVDFIAKKTFIKYCINIVNLPKILQEAQAYGVELSKNIMSVKRALIDKLSHTSLDVIQVNDNETLFAFFKRLSVDYEGEKEKILQHRLHQRNVFNGAIAHPDTLRTIQKYRALTTLDVIRYIISLDYYFLRMLLSNDTVCIFNGAELKDMHAILLDTVHSVYQQHINVFGDNIESTCIHTQPMNFLNEWSCNVDVFNTCVPSIMRSCIVLQEPKARKCIGKHVSTIYIAFDHIKSNDNCKHLYMVKDACMLKGKDLKQYILPYPSQQDGDPIFNADMSKHVLRQHIKLECPFKNQNTMNNYLTFLNGFMFWWLKNSIGTLKLPSKKGRHCVLLIDNRPNIMDVVSTYATFAHLNTDMWSFVFIGSDESKQYMQYKLGPVNHGIKYIVDERLNKKPFDIETYNAIMKDSNTWRMLHELAFEKCLVIQDDGIILRKGIDTYLDYDYVGAPWVPGLESTMLNLTSYANKELVGNGGLSLRTIRVMMDICEIYTDEKHWLFNQGLQPLPEDVYFSRCVPRIGGNLPSREVASKFAMEQTFCPGTLGIHKFWAYFPNDIVYQFMDKLFCEHHV